MLRSSQMNTIISIRCRRQRRRRQADVDDDDDDDDDDGRDGDRKVGERSTRKGKKAH